MTIITRERLLKIQRWRETYGPGSNVVLPAEEAEELARIALASLEAEPVAWIWKTASGYDTTSVRMPRNRPGKYAARPLYTAPPAPVVPDERSSFNAWNNDTDCPLAGLTVKQAAWLAWLKRSGTIKSFGNDEELEPVSNRDELPLNYLQGHKDGLEWAAQLAEANHPQTGDWLYDDPIELAKVIRRGPDMPEGGNSPVTPDGWVACSERMPPEYEPVYIFHPDYGVSQYVWYDHQEDAFVLDDETRFRELESVSHWMAMPAPPAAPQQEAKNV
ncbi:DUF551 domain-containing protein [Citrobacter farmeri]|uniref:DUF551 domain-containing protein n=1 Tax=Citrobacter farmeri TaxID=67824 RepID=UPI002DB5BD19|nr:DUF551 domain-containing protein [Citrobacter farmeri]MEC3930108.1 DUF551 domain-containing protein [Citrobacter farmeri]